MENNFSRRLKAKLAQMIEDRAMSLARGDAHTFEIYRHQVGFVEGLQASINICEDLEKEGD